MKNLAPFLFLLLLSNCTNNKTVDELIRQNNAHYRIVLEEYKETEKNRQLENPSIIDLDFDKIVFQSIDAIPQLKDQKTYDTLYDNLQKYKYQKDSRKIIIPIKSDDVALLKNNLYLVILDLIKSDYLRHQTGLATRCGFGSRFKIRKSIEKDSVKLQFLTFHQYQIEVDEILDGNKPLSQHKSDSEYVVWNVSYKSQANESRCKGKIFFRDESMFGNYLMVQKFDEKTTK